MTKWISIKDWGARAWKSMWVYGRPFGSSKKCVVTATMGGDGKWRDEAYTEINSVTHVMSYRPEPPEEATP